MTGLRYVGNGSWIPGVPARDLSAEEAVIYADLIEATRFAGHTLYVALPALNVPAKDAPVGKKKEE